MATAASALLPVSQAGTTEFLSGSHFRVSQDASLTPATLQSVFKRDYAPWPVTGKPPGAVPPAPADVLSRDDRYFGPRASETHHVYTDHEAQKPDIVCDPIKLRGTNFKMDKDLSRFHCYDTTHELDFPPRVVNARSRPFEEDSMRSCIPQGDASKVGEPLSDYKDRYRGHDARTTKPDRAPCGHHGGAPTITGDSRQHQYTTTHGALFPARSVPRVRPFPAPVGTNIPCGDRRQQRSMITIQQAAYPQHNIDGVQAYNKESVMEQLHRTNFKQKDGVDKWQPTTMSESYEPKHSNTVKFVPSRHRNASDLPEGDDSAGRNADRANMTTNRFYHANPPYLKKPTIVLGANLRTKSNVLFGEPRQADTFYSTSTDSVYEPKNVPYSYQRPDFNTRSHIPVHYYENDGVGNNSTYKCDFDDPETGKLIPNPEALKNLKESHIRAPAGGERWFSTEHIEQYLPKYTPLVPIDAGRLQRSSVPLGTMAH